VIPAGTYTLALGEIIIAKDLTLSGAGVGTTIIQAATETNVATRRVLRIRDSTVTIDGVTIRYGKDVSGGGILVENSTVTVSNSSVSGNDTTSGPGGGILANDSVLTVATTTITDNTASGGSGGGIHFNNSSEPLTLTASEVTGNSSSGSGGGIYSNGGSNITNSSVDSNNTTSGSGGGLYSLKDSSLTNSSFNSNSAYYYGANGGGIYHNSGILTVASSTINLNTITSSGYSGGGIYIGSSAGSAPNTLTDTIISGNSARYNGGGLYAYPETDLTRTTVSGNSLTSSGGEGGGGIYSYSGGTYTDSTISGNLATYYYRKGGGIRIDGSLDLINVTISGNNAYSNYGDGMHISYGATVTMTNVTVYGNYDNGIYFAGSSLTLVNSIVAGHGTECTGSGVTSLGHNLVGRFTSCFEKTTGDLMGSSNAPLDARLGPLQDNGGSTETHALLEASLAIHAGNDTLAPSTDQRGIARPQGSASDIGAFERVIPAPGVAATTTPTVVNAPIELTPETTTARVDGSFSLDIWTNATTTQAITGVEIYLDFDPVFLEVEDSESSSSGVQIEPDKSSLDTVLASLVDNSQGTITYSIGKLVAPYPTGAFKVATIHFTAKQATTESIPTEITFSFENPRLSKVDYGGDQITGQAVNASSI
jgi:hypothetical protein